MFYYYCYFEWLRHLVYNICEELLFIAADRDVLIALPMGNKEPKKMKKKSLNRIRTEQQIVIIVAAQRIDFVLTCAYEFPAVNSSQYFYIIIITILYSKKNMKACAADQYQDNWLF